MGSYLEAWRPIMYDIVTGSRALRQCVIEKLSYVVPVWWGSMLLEYEIIRVLKLWKQPSLQHFKIARSSGCVFFKKEWAVNLCRRNDTKNVHFRRISFMHNDFVMLLESPYAHVGRLTLPLTSPQKINRGKNLSSSMSSNRALLKLTRFLLSPTRRGCTNCSRYDV